MLGVSLVYSILLSFYFSGNLQNSVTRLVLRMLMTVEELTDVGSDMHLAKFDGAVEAMLVDLTDDLVVYLVEPVRFAPAYF